jgi:hypothetical protein
MNLKPKPELSYFIDKSITLLAALIPILQPLTSYQITNHPSNIKTPGVQLSLPHPFPTTVFKYYPSTSVLVFQVTLCMRFSHQNSVHISCIPHLVTCLAHCAFFDLPILIIEGEQCKKPTFYIFPSG